MTKKEFLKIKEEFEKDEKWWKSLKIGQIIHSTNGWDTFDHEILKVDIDNRRALVKDYSQHGKIIWTDTEGISTIFTTEEAKRAGLI